MEYKIIFLIIAMLFFIYCLRRWWKLHKKSKPISKVEEIKDMVNHFEKYNKK